MKMLLRHLALPALLGTLCFSITTRAQEFSAKDLAGRLSAAVLDGDSVTKLRMKIEPSGGGDKTLVQVQIKARRLPGKTQVVYQLLWPKERMGESFLLSKTKGNSAEGHSFRLPKEVTSLKSAQLKDSVFGSDLAYLDVVENFFAWESQSLAGQETINRVNCLILESKPGSSDSTLYGVVRSWVDPKKLVTMRVEKFDPSGKLVRRIDTDRVAKSDLGKDIPASLVVTRPGSGTVTELEGSNIRHDVKYSDHDFTVPAMADLRIPR
ncbi:MAG: outer membrane lipoprotein-sorting protein [Verrucomicrobiales bacterium]